MNEKVKVEHLTKKYGDLLVLDDISFSIKKGEFLCIVGPTGCGKTTFLNLLTKIIEPTTGNILTVFLQTQRFTIFHLYFRSPLHFRGSRHSRI